MDGALSPAELLVTVGPEGAGRRLDAVVGEIEEVGSRAEAQRLIADGRVLVDGEARPKRHPLAAGDQVLIRPRAGVPSALVPQEVPFRVVYEDEHLIVVDKPAGVVVHPSRGHSEGTLVHGLLGRAIAGGADPGRPGIVHRLDRDTSGLLVVARSERAHRRLGRLLRNHEIERRYIALVHGHPPPAMTVDRPVGRDPRVRTRMSTRSTAGRDAVTHLRSLETLARHTLIEARLETGRTHQIRVHLEAIGHPVAGDPTYGRRARELGLERQFLHAALLRFPHPETGQTVEAESPLPHELSLALGRARAL